MFQNFSRSILELKKVMLNFQKLIATEWVSIYLKTIIKENSPTKLHKF